MNYSTVDHQFIRQCVADKLKAVNIEQLLSAKGTNCETLSAHSQAFEKSVEKRRIHAFMCLGVGAFLGFVSCVLTLTNVVPSLYNVILYGLTSVAIIVIFIGLYLLLE